VSTAPGLITRPLGAGDGDTWERLARAHGTVFDSGRWTGLSGSQLTRIGIFDGGANLRGGFCVFEERRLGLRLFRNPPYTRQVGPFYEPRATNPAARTAEQRSVVEAMARYLAAQSASVVSIGLSHGIGDCLPFIWRRYKVVPHYTYRIDLRQSDSAIIGAFAKGRRNDVMKAQTDGLIAEEVAETGLMRSLVCQSFARNEKAFPRAAMDAILTGYQPGHDSYCFIALDKDRPVAGVYVVHDQREAYYLMGGYADGAHHGAGALAIWQAILKAKEMGLKVFDFEGSILPNIERYFRGFGGALTPIFSVHKAWFPLEIALKLVRRRIF
jgi:hypothetical protein